MFSYSSPIVLVIYLGYYIQKEHIKKLKGRRVLKDYTHEKKILYTPFINNNTIDALQNSDDPFFKYIKRYIKESGF